VCIPWKIKVILLDVANAVLRHTVRDDDEAATVVEESVYLHHVLLHVVGACVGAEERVHEGLIGTYGDRVVHGGTRREEGRGEERRQKLGIIHSSL
jgi:hypothetical protein